MIKCIGTEVWCFENIIQAILQYETNTIISGSKYLNERFLQREIIQLTYRINLFKNNKLYKTLINEGHNISIVVCVWKVVDNFNDRDNITIVKQ